MFEHMTNLLNSTSLDHMFFEVVLCFPMCFLPFFLYLSWGFHVYPLFFPIFLPINILSSTLDVPKNH